VDEATRVAARAAWCEVLGKSLTRWAAAPPPGPGPQGQPC